ncbi:polysaccharide biosynthesis/export family protein [Alteromonadaceae bacterium BrNp21-10]|nr:polysaccharide biosynthesis/export family protein [Alteromonadaceae bacterium BrNp21-10]
MAIRILSLLLLLISNLVSANDDQFMIGVGDTIVIDVYNEKDLFVRTKVSQSGMVRMPLIGSIQVINKTARQLGEELEVALLDGYLVHPSVTVSIEQFRQIYIKGAVKSAGAYDFVFDLTVAQAIAIAGGLKDRASASAWFIIRGPAKERIKATAESKILPGDTLTIDESIF